MATLLTTSLAEEIVPDSWHSTDPRLNEAVVRSAQIAAS